MYRRFFRDPGTGDAGGGVVEPTGASLAEIRNETMDADTRQQFLKAGYEPDGTTLKDGYVLDEVSGLPYIPREDDDKPPADDNANPYDDQGKLLDGWELVDGVPVKKEAPADDPADEIDESLEFFNIVETITGIPLQVDYGETDPTTPEGIALREKAAVAHGANSFETYIQTTFPDAYAYLLHRQAGGSKDAFFRENSNPSLPSQVEFEESADLQAEIVKNSLLARDVPAEVAQATVDNYIANNTLKAKALAIYKEVDKAQKDQIAQIQKTQREADEQFNRAVDSVMQSVDNSITAGEIRYIIPEADQVKFAEFVKEKIRYANGDFYIKEDNLSKLIESLFIQYSGNDLKKLVAKEARTIATEQFKLRLKKDAAAGTKGSAPAPNVPKHIPLSQI